MSKEIEKYFVKRLQSTLTEYLKDFSQNNVAKFSLGISNNIQLENLSIRNDVLLKFQIPMYIQEGKIGRIILKMPINYKAKHSQMVIENIDLTVTSISETYNYEQSKEQQSQLDSDQENYKKQKLRLWEEKMMKMFEELQPPTWIQQIVDSMYDNMSITVKKLTICYQNTSFMGCQTSLKFKFDKLDVITTNSNWEQQFNPDPKAQYKRIFLTKSQMTLQIGTKLRQFSSKDHEYVIYPIDLDAKVTIHKSILSSADQVNLPLQQIELRISHPLIIMLNQNQKEYLVKFQSHLSNLEKIQDNFHFRPQIPVRNNYMVWWKYAIQAIVEQQKKQKLDLNLCSSKIVLMKKYIALYKRKQNIIHVPWLTQWTSSDEHVFQYCERQLTLKELIKYREFAFTEIRLEAKRYFNSSKDGSEGKGVKPLLEIWTNTINNEKAFKDIPKTEKDDIPIELQHDEKINLYEILERDKANVLNSYLQGQNNDPNQKLNDLQLSISSIYLLLLEDKEDKFVNYSPKNLEIFRQCKCHNCHLKKKRNQEYMVKQSSRSYQSIQIQEGNNESFVTAKGNDNNIDSFISDLNDLEANENQRGQDSPSESGQNQIKKQGSGRSQGHRWSKLFLITQVLGVSVHLTQFRDGRMKSVEGLTVKDIEVVSPGCIVQCRKTKLHELLMQIFDITTTKDPVFLNSDQNFKFLLEFLQCNDMEVVADFIEKYEKDKNYFQEFKNEDFDEYQKYISEDAPAIFHKYQDNQNDYLPNVIEGVHSQLLEDIKVSMFEPFMEEYGERIMPQCIEFLRRKADTLSDNPLAVSVQFEIQGDPAEFKIIPNQKKNNDNAQIRQTTAESFVTVSITPFFVYLTTKTVKSLLDFTSSHSPTADIDAVITENQRLYDSIVKSQPLQSLEFIKAEQLNIDVNLHSFKVTILQNHLYVHKKQKIKVLLSDIVIKTLKPQDVRGDEFKCLLDGSQFYEKTFVSLKQVEVQYQVAKHNYATFLRTGLSMLVLKSLIDNHAVLVDSKVFIRVPFLKLHVQDDIFPLLELAVLLSSSPPQPQKKLPPSLEYSPDHSILIAELQSLYQDHTSHARSNCRHCVIKYRKTSSLLNLMLGHLPGAPTWFAWLDQKATHPDSSGLLVEFLSKNRIADAAHSSTVLALPFLLLTKDQGFFKDNLTIHCKRSRLGDNGRVSQMTPKNFENQAKFDLGNLNCREVNYIDFKPLQKVPLDFLSKIDEKHVFYCRNLENYIFKRDPLKHQTDVYLLAYLKKTKRTEMLDLVEENIKQKQRKSYLFFRLDELSVQFKNPLALCNIPVIAQNLGYCMQVIKTQWESVYGLRFETESQESPKSPVEDLEKFILLVSLNHFHIQGRLTEKLNLMISVQNVHIEQSLNLISQQIQCPPLMKCEKMELAIEKTSFIVQQLIVMRNGSIFVINFQNIGASQILETNQNSLNITLELAATMTEVDIRFGNAVITISKERIEDIMVAMKILQQLMLLEMREYKYHLKREIFFSNYHIGQKVIDFFHKEESQDKLEHAFLMTLNIESVQLYICKRQLEREIRFQKISLEGFSIQKGLDMYIKLEKLGLYPYPDQQHVNLFRQQMGNGLVVKISEKQILVILSNFEISVISVYLNELGGFYDELEREIIQKKQENLGKLKKSKRKQILDDLDKQVENQQKIKILLENCKVALPDGVDEVNQIWVEFNKGEFEIEKVKTKIQVPLIDEINQQKDGLIVDEKELMEGQKVHVNQVGGELKNVEVKYRMDNHEGNILKCQRLLVSLDSGLYNWRYHNCEYGNTVRIGVRNSNLRFDMVWIQILLLNILQNLILTNTLYIYSMLLNVLLFLQGKILKVAEIAKKNTSQKSELYESIKSKKILEKIKLQLDVKLVNLKQSKFTKTEEDSQFLE